MTVIYNNKDTGMLVNLEEVYSGVRAAVAPYMSDYENSLKNKIVSDLDFGNEVIVEHIQGGKASGRPGFHFNVYVQGFDDRKQALLHAYLNNLINSGGFVYGDADNGMIIRHPQPKHIPKSKYPSKTAARLEAEKQFLLKQQQLQKEKERKRTEKEKRRKSIIPTFRSDLDFVIRVPEAVLNSSDFKEAGSLLALVEKSVRQVYRKLHQVPKNVSIPVPKPRIKGFKTAIPAIPILPPVRSNAAKVATPSMLAKSHYSSEAILNAELEALKSKAFMPNETTLVLPAGSFNQNMYYLLSDLFEATEAGATLGFEKFTDASVPTEAKFDEIVFTTMPVQPKEPTTTTVTASGDEVVGSNNAKSEDKGLSNLAIGGIVAAVVVVGVGAFYLGKRR